ncbi:MAG: Nif3-like dinuclear metal center hexameric protein [Sideroxydans sp.]|nr:Nif3-like dinuclear metal center hexameric protein [Sideroxydans sp.]
MQLFELRDYTAQLLQTDLFKDYCPNGLQVQGRAEVRRIASAVSASQAVIDAATAWGADALLVHHGFFWRNEAAPIVGIKKNRIGKLLAHDMSLLAYHLPLDAHQQFGNNAELARLMGWQLVARHGDNNLLNEGELEATSSLAALATQLGEKLQRVPQIIAGDGRAIRRVAWCTGGAQGYFEQAIALGVDAYITGEISEQNFHLATESGVAFIAAGHHATEQFGIQALGAHLAAKFNLTHQFFNQDNPI